MFPRRLPDATDETATTSMKGRFFFFFFISILALPRSSIPEAKFGKPPETSQHWRQNQQFHRNWRQHSWSQPADHAHEQQRHKRAYVIRIPAENAQTDRIRTMVTSTPDGQDSAEEKERSKQVRNQQSKGKSAEQLSQKRPRLVLNVEGRNKDG